MSAPRPRARARCSALAVAALLLGCARTDQAAEAKPASSTLVVGIDVSGSFRDARIRPYGNLTPEEVARWTSAEKK